MTSASLPAAAGRSRLRVERSAPKLAAVARPYELGFRLHALLGHGGAASVYKASCLATGEVVALKVFRPDEHAPEGTVARLAARELRATRAAASPYTVRALHCALHDGAPALAFEYVDGAPLGELLAKGPLPPAGAVAIVLSLLAALHAAHRAGVVHRDVKPDNVMTFATDAGLRSKLVDFGIAKLPPALEQARGGGRLRSGLGTPLYMAPEQVHGFATVTPRADLFSAGAVLFHARSGQAPLAAVPRTRLLVQLGAEDAPDVRTFAPHVTPSLARIVARALARRPEDRYASARAMAAELLRLRLRA